MVGGSGTQMTIHLQRLWPSVPIFYFSVRTCIKWQLIIFPLNFHSSQWFVSLALPWKWSQEILPGCSKTATWPIRFMYLVLDMKQSTPNFSHSKGEAVFYSELMNRFTYSSFAGGRLRSRADVAGSSRLWRLSTRTSIIFLCSCTILRITRHNRISFCWLPLLVFSVCFLMPPGG